MRHLPPAAPDPPRAGARRPELRPQLAHARRGGGQLSAGPGGLPWGVVRPRGGRESLTAVRAGEDAILLARLGSAGLLGTDPELLEALRAPDLNPLIELGPAAWRDVRARLVDVLAEEAVPPDARLPRAAWDALRPVQITDFVDFYASEEHAANWGRIFRPGQPALADSWRYFPRAYHGRASTLVVSGTPVRRPRGQVTAGELAPTRALDLECEVGFVCGPSTAGPIEIDRAAEHLFGVVLVNDWSARDVQRLEHVPLGPFLGKSFATSMSAWITPLDALSDARVVPRPQAPPPAEYLRARAPWTLAIALEVELNGDVLSRPNASWLYWTPAQMLAHLTVNGAAVTAGDVFATGTVSGSKPGTEGSLGEIGRGERWLADGDEVVLRGRAGDVELAEVRARILPA